MALYNPPRLLIQIKIQKIICLIPVVNVILCGICWLYFRAKNVTKATRIFRLIICFPTIIILAMISSLLPEGTVLAAVGNYIYMYLGMWAFSRTFVWDQDRFCKKQNQKIKEYEDSLK